DLDLLHRLGRAVTVIDGEKLDLPPVDAALIVDHGEVRGFRLADGAIGRRCAAVGHGLADLDLAVAGAWAIARLRCAWPRGDGEQGDCRDRRYEPRHVFLLPDDLPKLHAHSARGHARESVAPC